MERDEDGRKHGITYRATVARRLPDGTLDIKATCEGTADYDESKFCQSAEQVQAKAEARERMWAKKDGRVANPTKWKGDPAQGIPAPGEYRADWNALMKRAQKRAIVGAVNDATAAGGIFSDREEDDRAPAPQDDGPTWYEQALEAALTFTDADPGGNCSSRPRKPPATACAPPARPATSRTASPSASSCSRPPHRSTSRTSAARPPHPQRPLRRRMTPAAGPGARNPLHPRRTGQPVTARRRMHAPGLPGLRRLGVRSRRRSTAR